MDIKLRLTTGNDIGIGDGKNAAVMGRGGFDPPTHGVFSPTRDVSTYKITTYVAFEAPPRVTSESQVRTQVVYR
jgi:hypothetical protein